MADLDLDGLEREFSKDNRPLYHAVLSELRTARARIRELERLDSEAANHVESVICMRTDFTGEPPYVGWKGLGLALNEALDRKEAAEADNARLMRERDEARGVAQHAANGTKDAFARAFAAEDDNARLRELLREGSQIIARLEHDYAIEHTMYDGRPVETWSDRVTAALSGDKAGEREKDDA